MSRNIQIREPGNLYQDVLHPETNSGMVLMENGSTLQEDLDAHKADYEYQTPVIVGTQIQLQKQSATSILKFKLDADLSGGEITISLDEGATDKLLLDVDGNSVTELDKGFVEVIEDEVNFTLRPSGAGVQLMQSGTLSFPSGNSIITTSVSDIDLNKDVLYFSIRSIGRVSENIHTGEIVDANTIAFKTGANTTTTRDINWYILRYKNAKSVQRGTVLTTLSGDNDFAISAVDPLKTFATVSMRNTAAAIQYRSASIEIKDSTTITIAEDSGTTCHYQVIEL